MKKMLVLTAALCSIMSVWAEITISPSSIDYAVGGGGAAIKTSGTGTWLASSDVEWITLVAASGNAGVACTYIVSRNNTADVREGHITISGNIYTVTQKGCQIVLSPTNVSVDKRGATGTVIVSVDAGVTWTATPSDSWISIAPNSGSGATELTYSVDAYDVVGSRTGTIRIGSEKFTVTQTGIDVTLSPVSTNVAKDVCIVPLQVVALTETKWTVTPNVSWISVLDGGNGYGGSQVTLAVAENPSFEKRVGTVTIGTAVFKVAQSGTDDVNFKILPEVATASPKGAFANVAVYATPDASWSAESMDSWIKITEGETGAGNGNVKYVTMSNPELEPRTGHIRFTPPIYTPELDLYAGLLFWIKDQVNIEGNELRQTSLPLSANLDGTHAITFSGNPIPRKETSSFACAISFKVDELDRINRLFEIGTATRSFYLDADNALHFDYRDYLRAPNWAITKADTWYTIVITHEAEANQGGELKIYAGEKGEKLSKIYQGHEGVFFDCTSESNLSNFLKLGQTALPSSGYLLGGQFADIKFWTRGLSDIECESCDIKENVLYEDAPLGFPAGVKYDFLPLNGNMFGCDEEGAIACKALSTGAKAGPGRFRTNCRSLDMTRSSRVQIHNFGDLFEGLCVTNNGRSFPQYYYSEGGNCRFPYPIEVTCNEDATYAFWINLSSLPESGRDILFCRRMSELPIGGCDLIKYEYGLDKGGRDRFGDITNNFYIAMSVDADGCLGVEQATGRIWFDVRNNDIYGYKMLEDRREYSKLNGGKIGVGEWHLITFVGRAKSNITVYLDGAEIGNVDSRCYFAWMPPIDMRWQWGGTADNPLGYSVVSHDFVMEIGGFSGLIDETSFYNRAFTAKEAMSMYMAGLPAQDVYHIVNQGIQQPSISPEHVEMSKFGGTTNIDLSVARTINWTATANDNWLTIVGDKSGTGPATVMVKASANPTCLPRTGTATIGTKTLTIHQDALDCMVIADKTVFPTEADETGGMGVISVSPEGNGSWTAESDVDWIYCFPESGTGSYDVYFFVEDMGSTAACRSGKIIIGGQTIEITQRGYELSIEPMIGEVGGNAGAGVIGVAADGDAVWTAISDVPWISIVQTTDKVVRYTFTDNTTGETRIGHINIAGEEFTLTQTCKLELNIQVIGKGTVTGSGKYAQGANVSLKATPASGYEFSHWSGDVVGVVNDMSVIMDTVKNVTATFIPEAAAQVLAEKKAAQGGFYTRDQIHALEMGNLVFDVDASGTARVGVQLMETSDLTDPNSWKPATLNGNPDVGQDGTVGMKVKANGNAKFFKVVMPDKQ